MTELVLAAEDDVGWAILRRLVAPYLDRARIVAELPVRGGQIRQAARHLNLIPAPTLGVLLTDQDQYDCAPALIRSWLDSEELSERLLFRVAENEAELWLLADRESFTSYFGISPELIPEPTVIDRRGGGLEIRLRYKASLFIMQELAPLMPDPRNRRGLTPLSGAKKGPAYNGVLLPFIRSVWKPEIAASSSTSLQRAIRALANFLTE